MDFQKRRNTVPSVEQEHMSIISTHNVCRNLMTRTIPRGEGIEENGPHQGEPAERFTDDPCRRNGDGGRCKGETRPKFPLFRPIHRSQFAAHSPSIRLFRRSRGGAWAIRDRPFLWPGKATEWAMRSWRPRRDLRRDPRRRTTRWHSFLVTYAAPRRGSHPTEVGSRRGSRTMRPSASRPRSGSMRPRMNAISLPSARRRPVCPR